MERWYKYIVIHHTATRCMSAEEMKLSMTRTWIQNRWFKDIPTHMIVWCSGDVVYVNAWDKIVWATFNIDANTNGIHIEVVWNFNQSWFIPTEEQYNTIRRLINDIRYQHPDVELKRHSDFQQKTCPWVNFNMKNLEKFVPIPHANGAKRPLPKIKGNTVEERARSFIEHYWYTRENFNIPWRNHWIKPEVLICIAWAEWFWKNSGSTGNIMNCWNNDRWDRVNFESWTESVECAANKLETWLLKNKQTIWDLSYAWNGKIDMQYTYASSNWPREINVRNCLGLIYNKNITPDFTFRK